MKKPAENKLSMTGSIALGKGGMNGAGLIVVRGQIAERVGGACRVGQLGGGGAGGCEGT